MKKLLIMLVFLSVLLVGCTTMNRYELLTSDDCLVIMKTKIINPHNLNLARDYKIKITGVDYAISLPKEDEGFIYLKTRRDGILIETISSKISDDDYTGESSKDRLDIPLPYAHGEVVVADFAIVLNMDLVSKTTQTSFLSFDLISEEEKREALKKAASFSRFETWFVD